MIIESDILSHTGNNKWISVGSIHEKYSGFVSIERLHNTIYEHPYARISVKMTICDTSERVHSTQSYSWINERGRHAQKEKDEKRGGEKKRQWILKRQRECRLLALFGEGEKKKRCEGLASHWSRRLIITKNSSDSTLINSYIVTLYNCTLQHSV